MAKVLILYAASSLHAALAESVITPARENGQTIRLIGAEFFSKGEPETNAAGVAFVRRDAKKHIGDAEKADADALVKRITDADEALFQAIVETYPDLEVSDMTEGKIKLPTLVVENSPKEDSGESEIKSLRAKLVSMGGSVPAGADKAKLEELIAAAELEASKGDKK